MRTQASKAAGLKKDRDALIEFTKGCDIEMHEPDNDDVSARVVGDHLDNAFGEAIREEAMAEGYQEFVVILKRGVKTHRINLATLIAIARLS